LLFLFAFVVPAEFEGSFVFLPPVLFPKVFFFYKTLLRPVCGLLSCQVLQSFRGEFFHCSNWGRSELSFRICHDCRLSVLSMSKDHQN
jgi:hypothetical protein